MKKAYHNRPPSDEPISASAPRDAVLIEFSRRLQRRMVEKGWNQSELARRAEAALNRRRKENGQAVKRFGRDLVSNYVRAIMLPGPVHLAALADALECTPDALLPARAMPSTDERLPPFEVKSIGGGMAWLRINQSVPFSLALKIGSLLEEWKPGEE